MPWTLWRHLTLATLGPFALLCAALSALLLLILSLRVAEIVPGGGLGAEDLLPLCAYTLPHLSLLTMPVTFLAGLLLSYGHLAVDGGYVAARAAGMGPGRLAVPAISLGVLFTGAGFALTLEGEPWGNRLLRREVVQLAKVGAAAGVRPGTFNDTVRDLTLYVGRKEEDGGLAELVLFDRRDPERAWTAFAREGRIQADATSDRLFLQLRSGEVQALERGGRVLRRVTFDRYRFDVDLREVLERRVGLFGSFEVLTLSEFRRAIEHVRAMGHPTWRYELAYHRKLSLPFAALVFALFGVALGLGGRRAPRLRAALWAAALVGAYYALSRAGDGIAAGGGLPVAVGAWLPNLTLLPAGIALLWRRARGRA
jgi:lipopolysaccharide export LptBFGC system permease protein LptF